MSFILGWTPFIINLLLCFADVAWILSLPISAIIGIVSVAAYYRGQVDNYEPGTEERKRMERKANEWKTAAITSATHYVKNTKNTAKNTTDPDKWDEMK